MQVVKRDGTLQDFNPNKIKSAILKAFNSCCPLEDTEIVDNMISEMYLWDGMSIEDIQDVVIETLRDFGYDDVAAAYSSYRNDQSRLR
jgi:ribonucleoside-triphosphate reductase